MKITIHPIILTSLTSLTFVLALGCSSGTRQLTASGHKSPVGNQSQSVTIEQKSKLIQLNSALVVPVELGLGMRSKNFNAEVFTDIANKALKDELDFEVFTLKDAERRGLINRSVKEIADNLTVDTIISIKLEHLEERVGTKLSADVPAEIAFSINAIRVQDGQTIWTDNYAYYDQAVSDNLLKLGKNSEQNNKNKGWSSEGQLFEQGVRELARKLQRMRLSAYTSR